MYRLCWGLILLSLSITATFAAAATIPVVTAPAGGDSRAQELSAGELFGSEGGYVHPFLGISEAYNSNVFCEHDQPQEDWITTFSPGVWLALPGMKTPLQTVKVLNSAAGGQSLSHFRTPNQQRMQGYALYSADVSRYHNFSAANETSQRAEGVVAANLRGGLGLEVLDVFHKAATNPLDANRPSRQFDRYTSNLANLSADYQIKSRLTLRADFRHYRLNYDAVTAKGLGDREDVAWSGYLFYKPLPKTAFFVQYETIQVDYDENGFEDNVEKHYFGGVRWTPSAKSSVMLKLGDSHKDFQTDSRNDLAGELLLVHQSTQQSTLSLSGSRRQNESDDTDYLGRLTHTAQLIWRRELGPKLGVDINLNYGKDRYFGMSPPRVDRYYGLKGGINFQVLRGVSLGGGYHFQQRTSNLPWANFTGNILSLNLTASL